MFRFYFTYDCCRMNREIFHIINWIVFEWPTVDIFSYFKRIFNFRFQSNTMAYNPNAPYSPNFPTSQGYAPPPEMGGYAPPPEMSGGYAPPKDVVNWNDEQKTMSNMLEYLAPFSIGTRPTTPPKCNTISLISGFSSAIHRGPASTV